MITKMTKYSFVLLSGEKEDFLEQLQEFGVVDISRSVKPVDQTSHELMARASKTRKAIETLEALDYSKDTDYEAIAKTTVSIEGDPVTFVEESIARLADLKNSLGNVERQMKARLPWGDYDRTAVEGLKDLGYKVRYYCIDKKRFDEAWTSEYALQIVSEDEKKVWFVTVSQANETYSFPIPETSAPEGTYAEAKSEAEHISTTIGREFTVMEAHAKPINPKKKVMVKW